MTIKEVIDQVYGLSVGGYFNREKFSKKQFAEYVGRMLRSGDKHILEIALPDGWWYMEIERFAYHEYDYYIPDSRVAEQRLIGQLFKPA